MRIAVKRGLVQSIIILSAMAVGIPIAEWMTDRSVPVEVSEAFFIGVLDPASTETKTVVIKQRFAPPGSTAVVRLIGEKFRNCPALAAGTVTDIDGDPTPLPLRLGQLNEPGPFDTYIRFQVPDDATPGWATFSERVSYGINILAGCFQPYVVGPPQRPPVRFCIGTEPCRWSSARRAS